MREIWGFAWFAATLCVIAMTAMIVASPEAALPAFFSFLPVVFFMIARMIRNLTDRISELENALENKRN